jgi:integrase
MAKRGLTPIAIAALKPCAERYEVSDPGCKGLRVAVQPTGARGFLVRYRRPSTGKSAKLVLGPWRQDPPKGEKEDPAIGRPITLAGARLLCADALHKLKQGTDPGKAKADAEGAAALAKRDTLMAIAENYLKREGPKLRTLGQRKSTFARLIYPALGKKPIGEIEREDVVALLDHVQDHHGPRAADSVLAALSKLFNWHATRSSKFKSPLVRGMHRAKPASERARTRFLNDDELCAVWHAAGDMGVFGGFIKFLLLTTARRDEAAAMRWSELSGLDWELPPERHKTGKKMGALVRPLSAAALAVLTSLPRVDCCEFVFSVTGRKRIYSSGESKRVLDERSGVTGWRLHDLRRTSRSLMSRASVNADVAERCLGHVIPGIRGVYDRHAYHAEKRHAFEALAALVERIVNPPAGVLQFPARA